MELAEPSAEAIAATEALAALARSVFESVGDEAPGLAAVASARLLIDACEEIIDGARRARDRALTAAAESGVSQVALARQLGVHRSRIGVLLANAADVTPLGAEVTGGVPFRARVRTALARGVALERIVEAADQPRPTVAYTLAVEGIPSDEVARVTGLSVEQVDAIVLARAGGRPVEGKQR